MSYGPKCHSIASLRARLKTKTRARSATPRAGRPATVKSATAKAQPQEGIVRGSFSFTLPYPPSANAYWRSVPYFDKKSGRWTVRVLVSARAKLYKQCAREAARAHGVEPLQGDTFLSLKVYRPRRSGDLGNRLKILEDALIGIAYFDDKQNARIEMERFDDAKNPRVEVTVSTLGFDDGEVNR